MKTVTYAAIADDDAIKTSIATSTSIATYSGVGLNGVIGATAMVPARNVTVTTGAHSGTYIGTAIVVTGTNSEGAVITETLTLTAVNGNETIVGAKGFKTVTSIAVPAQFDTSGTFKFGVRDIICGANPPKSVRCGGAGALKVTYEDGTTDTIADIAARESLAIAPHKIFGDSGTTVTNLTLFF